MDRSGALIFGDGASIVICGAAGQGIQTIERILPQLARLSGFHVCATKEYMSRIRGGSNSTEIRVSSRPVTSYARGIDLLIPLDEAALGHLDGRIGPRTLIVGDAARIKPDREIVDVPFRRMAEEIGGPIYENVVGAGVAAGIFGLDRGESENHIRRHFSGKKEDVAAANVEAFRAGFDRGAALVEEGRVAVEIGRSPDRGKEILASGAEAIALGALHGGCNFVAAYPMTPSTGVFAFLARHSEKLGIIAEQAEDEIAAINMSLGAWYAGARAMVTTSGGGFALMAEGLSLAGMIESPAVIFLSQRPGPATGLPTRTEQGDLLFALFAGHGEFPRAVLAPGTLEEAFSLTAKAFDLADRFQVPVIIMADQFFVDLQHNIPPFDMGTDMVTRHFVRTEKDYRRYEMSQNGLSPRGIPGYGEGLVGLDSDEHDEAGHITEDFDLRRRMVDKRLAKAVLLAEAALPPVLFGQEEYETLLVGWGSTCGPVREAAGQVGRDGISFLHVAQVHPLHRSVRGLLEKAKKVVVVENNATGQFASVLRMHLGIGADAAILKYDGMPFSVEELAERIEEEAAR